jgi:hypothetical protein
VLVRFFAAFGGKSIRCSPFSNMAVMEEAITAALPTLPEGNSEFFRPVRC